MGVTVKGELVEQRSVDIIWSGIKFLRTRIREFGILIAVWYLPVRSLEFLKNRLFSVRFSLARLDPLVDAVILRLLYGLIVVVVVDFSLRHYKAVDGVSPSLAATRITWISGIRTLVIPIMAAVPLALIKTFTLRTSTGIGALVLTLPFALLQLGVEFTAYLIIPVALVHGLRPLAAWKRSWTILQRRLDRSVVAIVLVFIISIVIAIPLTLFHQGYSPERSQMLYFLGYLMFSFPIGFSIALRGVVAVEIYSVFDQEATEPVRGDAP